MKPLSRINDEIVEKIIAGRPYSGIKDFMKRCPLSKLVMVNLIKAGAFDEIDKDFNNRVEIMVYYLSQACEPKNKLNLQNFNGLIQHNLVPKDLELQIRVFNFNKYIKGKKYKEYYILDDISIQFLEKFLPDCMNDVICNNGTFAIGQKEWDKVYQINMNPARDWLINNQQSVLSEYNYQLFKEAWDKYANGSVSKWEMESLCFYYGPHELANINPYKYGLSKFSELSSEPQVDYFFKRGGKQIPIFKLSKIIGTVIAKDDARSSITLLTTDDVVTVKFTREYYALFKKQISQIGADGKKKVLEKSWFTRGTKLMITGFRREDTFVAKTYANTNSHQLYKIIDIKDDEMIIQHERMSVNGGFEEDEEDYE